MVTGREKSRPRGGVVQLVATSWNSFSYVDGAAAAEPYNIADSVKYWQINQKTGIPNRDDLCRIHNRDPHNRCGCPEKSFVGIADAYRLAPDFTSGSVSLHHDRLQDWHDNRKQHWSDETLSLFDNMPDDWKPSHDVRDDRSAQYHPWIDRPAASKRNYKEDWVDFVEPFALRKAFCSRK